MQGYIQMLLQVVAGLSMRLWESHFFFLGASVFLAMKWVGWTKGSPMSPFNFSHF